LGASPDGSSPVFRDINNLLYNPIYTILPALCAGIHFVGYSAEDILRAPGIYKVLLPGTRH
jgi:hypothetical protein